MMGFRVNESIKATVCHSGGALIEAACRRRKAAKKARKAAERARAARKEQKLKTPSQRAKRVD